jgi:PPOX class probable F420-dependent enzyme
MSLPETQAIPEHVRDILEDMPMGHLATLRSDGRLSVNPVAVVYDGTYLRVSTVKSRVKYKNLVRDPRLAISIPHRKDGNRYIEVRGRAILEDDTDRSFINGIAKLYMGQDEYPFDRPGDERVTITIIAEQVSTPRIPLAGKAKA